MTWKCHSEHWSHCEPPCLVATAAVLFPKKRCNSPRTRVRGNGAQLCPPGAVANRPPLLQVYSHFRQQGAGAGASFSLIFLEGMHWKQAAALFDQADVVVSPHGAQTSQALFLPLHSQFLHLDNNAGHAMLTAFVIDVRPPWRCCESACPWVVLCPGSK